MNCYHCKKPLPHRYNDRRTFKIRKGEFRGKQLLIYLCSGACMRATAEKIAKEREEMAVALDKRIKAGYWE